MSEAYVVRGRRIPRNGEVAIMFLGGPLDHTIRPVVRDEIDPGKPGQDMILYAPAAPGKDFGTVAPDEPCVYLAQKQVSGPWTWWVYVKQGHVPRVIDYLDANPFPFVVG